VVCASAAYYRRPTTLERLGSTLDAAPGFGLVLRPTRVTRASSRTSKTPHRQPHVRDRGRLPRSSNRAGNRPRTRLGYISRWLAEWSIRQRFVAVIPEPARGRLDACPDQAAAGHAEGLSHPRTRDGCDWLDALTDDVSGWARSQREIEVYFDGSDAPCD